MIVLFMKKLKLNKFSMFNKKKAELNLRSSSSQALGLGTKPSANANVRKRPARNVGFFISF